MLVSQKIAIAAHLHVLLRRKTGRVTDTEWMAVNLDYAREIVRFSRERAAQDGHPELAEWAGKLERAVLGLPAADGSGHSVPFGESGFTDSVPADGRPPTPRDPDAPRYVRGLR